MTVEAYLNARTAFSNARAEIQSIADLLNEVGGALGHKPDRFIFANQPVGLPMEASLTRDSKSVDAQSWPTVERIMRVLERYHAVKSTLEQAWQSIPASQKEGLRAPDDLIGRR